MTVSEFTAEDVLETLMLVVDPERGINIVDLGLVHGVEVDHGVASIEMTLTSPTSESKPAIEAGAEQRLKQRFPELAGVNLHIVWEPKWRDDFITAEGRLQLEAPPVPIPVRDTNDLSAPLSIDDLLESLMYVIDPEVGINIVYLGLVYGVKLDQTVANIRMTLTTPGCPLHHSIEAAVKRTLQTRHPELTEVNLNLVWEPKWGVERITLKGRQQLGW